MKRTSYFLTIFFPVLYWQGIALANNSCGEKGTLEQRIISCNHRVTTSVGTDWSLVTRTHIGIPIVGRPTEKSMEVWIDHQSNLVWSDALHSNDGSWYPYLNVRQTIAENLCGGLLQESYDADERRLAELASLSKGFLGGTNAWRLPSKTDYEVAESHGLLEILPSLFNTGGLWTTSVSLNRAAIYLPYLSGGKFASYDTDDHFAFRCVGIPNRIREVEPTQPAPVKTTCGLSGSIAKRIKDCNISMKRAGRGSHGDTYLWKLVTRAQAIYSAPGEQPRIYAPEVWLDVEGNTLWSAPFEGLISFSYNSNHLQEQCDTLRTLNLHSYNLPNVQWTVPSKAQLESVQPRGMQFVPTDMIDEWFWSSTLYDGDHGFAYVLGLGGISYNSVMNSNKLRCQAQLSEEP